MKFIKLEILNKIKSHAIQKEYFKEELLSNISDGACENNQNKYIDFDHASNMIAKEKGIKSVKSCDSLIFNEKIIFIEFKNFQKLFENDKEEQNNFFNKLPNNLDKKVEYSKNTLQYISDEALQNNEKEYYKSIDKQYYLVVNIKMDENPKFYFTTMLNILASTRNEVRLKNCDNMKKISENMI